MTSSYQPSAFNYQPVAVGLRAGCPLGARWCVIPISHRTRPAFSLLEITIVVAILALLIGIAVPAGTAVLNSTRSKTTLKTMEVLKQVIEEYRQEHPNRARDGDPVWNRLTTYFGDFPPHDYSLLGEGFQSTDDTNDNGIWDEGETFIEIDGNHNQRYDPACLWRDIPGVSGHVSGTAIDPPNRTFKPDPNALDGNPLSTRAKNQLVWDSDNRSIEALYLYTTLLTRSGAGPFEKLGVNIRKNADMCTTGACNEVLIIGKDSTGKALLRTDPKARVVDVMEIYDAWGRPLRYQVHRVGFDPENKRFLFEWELRSAGPDGIFAPMFSDESQGGDDVVMRGK